MQVYAIRELERISGLPRTTIQYYLREGLLPRPQKTATSRSLYTTSHVTILEEIAELKREGLSVGEMKTRLQPLVNIANESSVDLAQQEYARIHGRILALAMRNFASKGYRNTHVTTIMREIGVTATVFYSHFPSKRRLLGECVTELVRWSLEYLDSQTETVQDPGESLLRLVNAHSHVFELGMAALAVIRIEGSQADTGLRESIESGLGETVQRIEQTLTRSLPQDSNPPTVPDRLLALSLFGAYEQTAFRTMPSNAFSRKDLLRTHLWLFLAARAARKGEIDIDSRLESYGSLIDRLSSELPPFPPEYR